MSHSRGAVAVVTALLVSTLALASVPHAAQGLESSTEAFAVTSIVAGDEHTCALFANGVVKCWGNGSSLGLGDTYARGDDPGEMGRQLGGVDLGTGRSATAITAGSDFTCALLDDGTVKCWGGNEYGQLGQGDDEPRGATRGQMGDALAPVDLGIGRTAVAVEAVTVGVCALLDDASVKCWGAAGGRGDREPRGDEPGEMGEALPPIDLGT